MNKDYGEKAFFIDVGLRKKKIERLYDFFDMFLERLIDTFS